MNSTVVMIMAGGAGSRLSPLTVHRAKPAVPIGGRYRIVDFVLSNFVNSGYDHIYVLTQYMASSLIGHLNKTWHIAGPTGAFIEEVPAQMRVGDNWYRGTADSVFQNLNLVADHQPAHVAVFGGDHVYIMDVSQMEDQHRATEAALTIAAYPVRTADASRFGILQVDARGRVVGFEEKPEEPMEIPGRPGWALASMGNYFFRTRDLIQRLVEDAQHRSSTHDFGKDIIPSMVREGLAVYAYDFGTNKVRGSAPDQAPYWEDVGTIDSYFAVNMDMREQLPPIDLYNRTWRIRSAQRHYPPVRCITAGGRGVTIEDSMVCEGSILSGASIRNAMVGMDCMVHQGATVSDAVILSGCNIGAGSRLSRVLFDKNCSVAPGVVIGEDPEADRERFPFWSPSGVVVLPKGTHVPRRGPIEFAGDIAAMLRQDPVEALALSEREGAYIAANRGRHSFESVGPRFDRFAALPTGSEETV